MKQRAFGLGVHLVILTVVLLSLCLAGCRPAGMDRTGTSATDSTPQEATAGPTTNPTATEATVAGELATYVNADYGFSFRYPSEWQLMEGQNFVSLMVGSTDLVIGYRHATEDRNICCRGQLPEGELVEAGTVACIGEDVEKALLTCEGKTKAVIYQGTEEIAVGDLRFLFYVEDFSADYDAANIPQDEQVQMDRVISSLTTFEPTARFATATPRPTRLPPTPEPTAEPTTRPIQEPTSEPTAARPPATANAGSGRVNLRSGPGTDYALAGYLEAGEQVEIIGRHGEWWQVRHGDGEAWVFDGVVDASNVADVPEVESIPVQVSANPAVIPTAAPASEIEEERWIDVDLSEQRLRAYEGGKVVRTTLVSTGLPQTPTVQGQFRIWIKLRYDDMEGADYYLEDVAHVMYFYQGYGLHAAPWHNNFGHQMSHGCVNLPLPEAEWLFNFADVGTLVNVHE